MSKNEIKIISYNIRKCAGRLSQPITNNSCNRNTSPNTLGAEIGDALAQRNCDFILCQEYAEHDNGSYLEIEKHLGDYERGYEPNKHTKAGHHGNASFSNSKHQVIATKNHNISTNPIEKRGVLHTILRLDSSKILHLFNAHLGLNQVQRNKQVQHIKNLIDTYTSPDEALIIAGDFNDWNDQANKQLEGYKGLNSLTHNLKYRNRRTWPSEFPILSLDRIYTRNMQLDNLDIHNSGHWQHLSDHYPIEATLSYC